LVGQKIGMNFTHVSTKGIQNENRTSFPLPSPGKPKLNLSRTPGESRGNGRFCFPLRSRPKHDFGGCFQKDKGPGQPRHFQ